MNRKKKVETEIEEDLEEEEIIGEELESDLTALKFLSGDRIGAYAVIFGNSEQPDLSRDRDYFTPKTDFWLDKWTKRPMLYEHGLEEKTSEQPVVGFWDKAEMDEIGIWVEGQLDRSHKFYEAIRQLVADGALRLSSDSASHLVRRKANPDGTHEIVRWPLLAVSLTPTPAEPRLRPVTFIKSAFKSLGVDLELEEEPSMDEIKKQEEGYGYPQVSASEVNKIKKLLQQAIEALDKLSGYPEPKKSVDDETLNSQIEKLQSLYLKLKN